MTVKDYYKVLGVSKNASDSEIKKAFRKMAMQYHPDRHQGDKGAEEKFKEINEAYAVLSDSKKRKQFDMFGAEGFGQRFSQEDIFRNFDIGSIFKEMGYGGSGGDIFGDILGAGRQSGRSPFGRQGGGFNFDLGGKGFQQQRAQPTKGSDLEYELSITLEEAASGEEKQVAYRRGREKNEVKVKIPTGITDNQKLRLAGKGLSDVPGKPAGDLFFNIKVKEHPVFKREGNDLTIEREIKFSEAVLGMSLEVPSLTSESKKIKVPAGTQSNTIMRLKGQGMPVFRGGGKGDLYVKISIFIPKKLSSKQKKLVQGFAETEM